MAALSEIRLDRRDFLTKAGIVAATVASTPLIEALFPFQVSAESDKNIIDITYREFADLPENHERLLRILRESPKTLRVTLNVDTRMERLDIEPIDYLGDSQEALIKSMVMEREGRGNLIYIYTPADQADYPSDFTKGKALELELIPLPEEKAINLAQKAIVPFIFRGVTEAPAPTPAPTQPTLPPKPIFPSCPLWAPGYENTCPFSPIEYASVR